jgi:hypothetical protein
MSDETAHIERWTYLGEFPGKSVAKVATWRAPDGSRRSFPSKTNTRGIVGMIYEARLTDEGSWMPPATWTGDAAEDCDALKLEADDGRRLLNVERDQRAARKNLTMSRLTERAQDAAKGLSYTARAEMIRQLSNSIWAAK